MKNVTIKIEGLPKSGKTTIAKLIESALLNAGAAVSVIDDGDSLNNSPKNINAKVVIRTINLPRG